MKKDKSKTPPLPTKAEILEFISSSPQLVGKREISRAFHLRGQGRLWLKDILKELAQDGQIERGARRHVHEKGKLPSILLCEATAEVTEHGEIVLVPLEDQKAQGRILLEDKRATSLNPGDHVLVKLNWIASEKFYAARLIRSIPRATRTIVGQVEKTPRGLFLIPADRRRQDVNFPLLSEIPVEPGDLVLAKLMRPHRSHLPAAHVHQVLGKHNDPHAISLIALYEFNIPHIFSSEVLKEAETVAKFPLEEHRVDLRDYPLVTIDGEDARDFDDAVWAEHTETGWHILVAIADVSYYVRPGSKLDQEAYLRGNSVYFPDRVVPMLPEALSNEMCSLKPDVDRACLAVHLWLDSKGRLKKYEFVRGLMRSRARLTYTQVQAAFDGNPDEATAHFLEATIKPLYGAYALLKAAREYRGTLDFEIPEQKVIIDDSGHISHILPRERYESHKLIEEFMILANVAAAQQLEQLRMPNLYRIHDAPTPEKLAALRETLQGLGIAFPKGQTVTPKTFQNLLNAVVDSPQAKMVNELTLRTQAKALYHPENIGHFGLSLTKYSHFTSPIRRYADLIVHRSLVKSLKFGPGGLEGHEDLYVIGDHISTTERQAAAAERASIERYITLFLKEHLGKVFRGHITGVANFGLFVSLDETGATGLIPIRTLPSDYYLYEEHQHRLVGRSTRFTFTLGDPLMVTLSEANPLTNTVTLELYQDKSASSSSKKAKAKQPLKKKPSRPRKSSRKVTKN
ncbi:Ribonuclease R [Candidatus Bealeia paramacronuclearis]|uniref:Ribonuclease R n=1 Tax=Candidatus Bealeia paramacronuclearis TaxID=1921001 RepID=A0ABZ2C1X3_9PROT|nr:Ribonuclease R [Candidatus Bealeia paramacronuclearis]